MSFVAENMMVVAIVAAAAAYLGRRAWTIVAGKRHGGCGTCGTCPTNGEVGGQQVIAIESLVKPPRQTGH